MDVLRALPRLFSLIGWVVILGGAAITGGGFWFIFVYEPSWGSWWLGLMWIVWCIFWTVFWWTWVMLAALAAEYFLGHRAAPVDGAVLDDTVVMEIPRQRRRRDGDDVFSAI